MSEFRTHGSHSAIDDDLPAIDFDVEPCRGVFQVQKTGAKRTPIQHHRFATAEAAAGRLIASRQGDSFDILQVVARVTLSPRRRK